MNKKCISSLIDIDVKSLELCFVSVKIDNTKNLIVGCIYFPPNSPSSLYNDYFSILDNLISSRPNDDLLLFGDFNLPNLNKASLNANLNLSSPEAICLENLSLLNLYQINTIFNSHGSILDLILSNSNSHSISLNKDSIVPVDNYHPPINISYSQSFTPSPLYFSEETYDWYNGDYTNILSFLGSINWNELFNISNDITTVTEEFYSLLFYAINNFIPKKKFCKSKFPCWFSKNLINLIKLKKFQHSIFKLSNSHDDYQQFSSTRAQCKSLSRFDYSQYLIKIQKSFRSQPKKFWSFIENIKKSSGLPNSMSFNHKKADNGQEIVDLFSQYFSSVYKDTAPTNINFQTNVVQSIDSLNSLHIELLEVFHELNILSSKNAIGPDGLSPIFLFNCRFILSPPITYLFNLCLNSGSFPSPWKSTYINPIPKKGNKSFISNYRPISIISILPKIFSKIINNKLTPMFKHILAPQQHGFRNKKSCLTNLITIKHHIIKSFSNNQQTDVIYTDFEKAFDRVNHSLLINKLQKIGFANPLLSWFNSFLSQRIQFVKYKNFISTPMNVISGVPQGDHLSPLLFNLFINDSISSISHSSILLFADDAKIYKSITSPDDIKLLQSDLASFNEWCISNSLSLNIDKCQIVTYSKKHNPLHSNYQICDINLHRSSLIKDLGILFDSKLLFNAHVSTIKNKALSVLGMIKRNCSDFRDPLALKCLYTSLVRSLLEYAPLIWNHNNIGHNDQLDKVQNKALRFICHKCNIQRTPHSGYDNILKLLNLEPLNVRRHLSYNTFLTKLLNNEIDDSFILSQLNFKVNSHYTRNNHLFYIRHSSKKFTSYDPINILMSSGNS